MKKATSIVFLIAVSGFLFIYFGCQTQPKKTDGTVLSVANPSSRLPQDVFKSCTISQGDFNSWFASGKASENGNVLPANSVTFGHNNNCDFYKWSWQMFAWMTSPQADKKTVMESQVFYTVTPDSAGIRTLLPHTPGKSLQVTSSITQFGPHNLPTVMDKQGHIFEIEKPTPNIKPMLLKGNQRTMISQVEISPAGKPVFKDPAGQIIENPKAVLVNKGNFVQEFKATNGKAVFVGANGPIESEEGQASGNSGLMAQNGSLVYYITMVNDVFAFYLSGAKNGKISGAQFPTTAAQRDSICAIARANGNTVLPDSNALAIEIKTSWVEASSLPDPQNYITINAVIPSYNKTDSLWTPTTNPRTVKLAMLGMHVVGSVAGHPEMVWATFEEKNNAPNAAYQYLNSDSMVVNVPRDSTGKWTLSSNALDPKPNQAHFTASGNTLIAVKGSTISASNSQMSFPWGSAPNVSPNKQDGSSAASNSEVISINNTVLGMLVGNDIRKKYLLVGATWTSGGAPPTGNSYSTNPTDPGAAIGTSLLANVTMETYKQSNKNSCFTCHRSFTTPNLLPGNLSHVYTDLQPLQGFMMLNKNR